MQTMNLVTKKQSVATFFHKVNHHTNLSMQAATVYNQDTYSRNNQNVREKDNEQAFKMRPFF